MDRPWIDWSAGRFNNTSCAFHQQLKTHIRNASEPHNFHLFYGLNVLRRGEYGIFIYHSGRLIINSLRLANQASGDPLHPVSTEGLLATHNRQQCSTDIHSCNLLFPQL